METLVLLLATHLRMDVSNAMFTASYLVPACYGSHGGTTSYRACIHRSSCLWGGVNEDTLWGADKALDKCLWIVIFLLVLSALLPKKIHRRCFVALSITRVLKRADDL